MNSKLKLIIFMSIAIPIVTSSSVYPVDTSISNTVSILQISMLTILYSILHLNTQCYGEF